jgi:hypothetical protein
MPLPLVPDRMPLNTTSGIDPSTLRNPTLVCPTTIFFASKGENPANPAEWLCLFLATVSAIPYSAGLWAPRFDANRLLAADHGTCEQFRRRHAAFSTFSAVEN